jgi:hypothetical protein
MQGHARGDRMTSGRRYGLIAAVVVVAAMVMACGYVLGSSKAPSGAEAERESREAAGPAFAAARAEAFARGINRGLEAGAAAGQRRGEQRGNQLGAAKGLRAARQAFNAVAVEQAGRAESEADIGYSVVPGSGDVLVVGDSLEVLTSPYLKRYLPPNKLTVNAVGGYSSLQIFELFQESYDASQSVVVFDAGTNDNPSYPEILAGRLQAVAKIVGDRCMVVPTIHGLSVDGVNSAAKNRVVRAFAGSRPATVTPDWAGFVATHPELMQSDDLHPTAEGADARAQLIAEGVRSCQGDGASGPRSGSGGD